MGGEFRHCRKHLQGYKSWVKRSDKQQVDETKEKKKKREGGKMQVRKPTAGGLHQCYFFWSVGEKKNQIR